MHILIKYEFDFTEKAQNSSGPRRSPRIKMNQNAFNDKIFHPHGRF